MASAVLNLSANEFFYGQTNLALSWRLISTNKGKLANSFVDALATETLARGNKKLFPFSDLPEVVDYSETSSALSVTKVATNEESLTLTDKKLVKSSYSTDIMYMAYTDIDGMNQFVGYLLSQMSSSTVNFIYNKTIEDLFGFDFSVIGSSSQEGYSPEQTLTIKYADTSGVTDPTEANNIQLLNNKNLKIQIERLVENMQVYADVYSNFVPNTITADGTITDYKVYTTALAPEDIRLIITAPYYQNEVVNLMATLLKSQEITDNFTSINTLQIPAIKIPTGEETVIGWLGHKEFYQWFYFFQLMRNFNDPSTLAINNFLHTWFGRGRLKNLPVVKLVADTTATVAEVLAQMNTI